MIFHNESAFNGWLSGLVEASGARVLSLVGSTMQEPGWPDRYWAHRTWDGWVEGKKDGGTLSVAQHGVLVDLLRRETAACSAHLDSMKGWVEFRVPLLERGIVVELFGVGVRMLDEMEKPGTFLLDRLRETFEQRVWGPGGAYDRGVRRKKWF